MLLRGLGENKVGGVVNGRLGFADFGDRLIVPLLSLTRRCIVSDRGGVYRS